MYIMKTKNSKVNIITLGCSKNLVDSENLATQLKANNIKIEFDSYDTKSQVVVINTCGFIQDSKQESIDTILSYIELKEQGNIEQLYVMGCLSERYKHELAKEIPEVDEYFGVNNLKEIIESLGASYKKQLYGERTISTPKHYAYLKISEGCDRKCSFCAIPLIRGKHKSIPIEKLVDQAIRLVNNGVKEILLIAQDITYYGLDIYKKQMLNELLIQLSNINGLEWIRLHYAYPSNFPYDIIKTIKQKANICNYIDIPFQHISNSVLGSMKRGHKGNSIHSIITKFRESIPDIAFRTTLIVGYPGETDSDFELLKEFVREAKFERLGVFTYSEEENTYAADILKDDISEKTKTLRANEIMEIQQEISAKLNQAKIGKTIRVIIDKIEKNYYIGRTQYDSPEVDNEVLINIEDADLNIGSFYNVKIISSNDFDLFGSIQ